MRTAIGTLTPLLVLLFALPWWLPQGVGGDVNYNFILTGSMRGALDPGSFVMLRQSDLYAPGDVAGYRLRLENGREIIIVHRIMERLPSGDFVFKGDANQSSEIVRAEYLVGKMVFGVPGLGLAAGAVQSFPLLIAAGGVVPMVLLRGKKKSSGSTSAHSGKLGQRRYLFFGALAAIAIGIPLYSIGLAGMFGAVPVAIGMVLSLMVARVLEIQQSEANYRSLAEISYVLLITLSVTMVSATDVLAAFQMVIQNG